MIEESVAFLVAQGKRVIYDAEHFFDGWRDDREYALRCLRAAVAGGRRDASSCATRTARRCPARSPRRRAGVCAGARTAAPVGIHCHDDAGCGVANSLAAVEAGATHVQGTMNGFGERCGNANLVTIIANLQLKLGHEVRRPRAPGDADRDRALRRRAAQPRARTRTSPTWAATRSPTRAACTSPASARTRRRSSTSTRRSSATAASCSSPSCPAAARCSRGPQAGGPDGRRRDGARASSSASRSSSTRGYHFEAADGSFELLMRKESGDVRAAVPARVLAGDRREARRRQGRDRGDDQDLGRRRALRAHGRGQRPGQRARRARCARRSPRSTRTCATSSSSTSRSASSTRPRAPARSRACSSTPPTASDVWGSIGVAENVIAASWQALVDSLEYADAARARRRPPGGRDARAGVSARSRPRSRRPRPRAREEEQRGPRGPALRPAVARAARAGVRATRSPRASACRTRAPSRAAPPACTSRCARSASATATRSSRRRSRSSPARTPRLRAAPGRSSPTSTR